ncbi:hypothetical protein SteCoe_11784 [Stentor coeruleus]|uniref:Uncharacterized protein n=1 Tax=Stentor coeruleus TaxID=5963 RepID=A0A1R2CCC5_9CILI|nr:hypothetical protein SteCoe_11784 [Stentor coeruleus]
MGCSESRTKDEDEGPRVKKNSKNFQFELYAAIKSSRVEAVKDLLKNNFDISYKMPNFMGRTALHIAAEYGNKEIILTLLEKNADMNALDSSGCPPVFLAMSKGHLEIVSLMIEGGANANIVTNHDLSLHDFICVSKTKESMNLLKKIKYSKIKL